MVRAMIDAAVLTVSDRCARGERVDTSGPTVQRVIAAGGANVIHSALVPDEPSAIAATVRDWVGRGVPLIITTGGTGLSARDVTPETLRSLGGREVPGLAEAIRAEGLLVTPFAALSRQVALQIGGSIVIALPGSPSAVEEGLRAVSPLLPHLADMTRSDAPTPPALSIAEPFVRAWIDNSPLDVDAIVGLLPLEGAGAVATFTGVTRSPDEGREILALRYEAWEERAASAMANVAREVCAAHGAHGAVVAHRIGTVEAGEPAIVAAVCAPHRREAFRALEDLVDRVKAEAPIWKQEHADEGLRWR